MSKYDSVRFNTVVGMDEQNQLPTIKSQHGLAKRDYNSIASIHNGEGQSAIVYKSQSRLVGMQKNLRMEDYKRINDYETLPKACIIKNLIRQ